MPETPKQTLEKQSEKVSFHEDLVRSVDVVGYSNGFEQPGGQKGPLKIKGDVSDLSEEELKAQIVHSTYDYSHRTFADLFRNNAAKNELRRLQLLKSRREKPIGFDDRELVVTDQASTYHQYFPEVLKATVRSAQKYEEASAKVPAEVRAQMGSMEGYTKTYLGELNNALDERLLFANILTLANHIAAKVDPNGRPLAPADIAVMRDRLAKLLEDKKLSKQSLNIFGGGTVDALLKEVSKKDDTGLAVLGNNLNQRLIEILGGKCGAGVPDDFTPMVLELELIRRHYDFVFKQESELSLDPRLTRAKERMKVLKAEFDDAEKNNKPFPKEKVEENASLQRQFDDRQSELDRMAKQRRTLSDSIVSQTDQLARYQMKMSGITTTQRMFGDIKDVPSLTSPLEDTTPDVVRKSINKNMKMRSDFHLQTLGEFLGAVDDKVMAVDLNVRVEDLSNKQFREFMRKLTGGIAHVVTLPIPQLGDLQLRSMAKNSMTGDLDRAMGWPPGVTDFDQLTDAQKQNVRSKAKSVYQAILEFKYAHEKKSDGSVEFGEYKEKEQIVHFKETMGMIKSMPPASTFVQGVPDEKAMEKRMSKADLDAFLSTINGKVVQGIPLSQQERDKGATIYMALFAQLNNDWGDVNPPSGFVGEYAAFMAKIDENIGTHFATASALRELSAKFFDWRDYLLYGILTYLGAKAALKIRKYLKGNTATQLQKKITKLTGEKEVLAGENATLKSSLTEAEQAAARSAARITELESQAAKASEQVAKNAQRIQQLEADLANKAKLTAEQISAKNAELLELQNANKLLVEEAATATKALQKEVAAAEALAKLNKVSGGLRLNNAALTAESRASSALEGLSAELKFAANGRDVSALSTAINEAHAIQPTGAVVAEGLGAKCVDGQFRLWSKADLKSKVEILKKAGFVKNEINYLMRNGYCGRSATEISELLIKSGKEVPKGLKAAVAAEAGVVENVVARTVTAAESRAAGAISLESRMAARSAAGSKFRVGGKLLGAAAIGIQAYSVFNHVMEAEAAKEHAKESEKAIEAQLKEAGFVEEGTVWKHKQSGITVNLRGLKDNLDGETRARYIEAGGAAAGLVILSASMMVGGPVGLVVAIGGIIVELTVEAVAGEFEMADRERFLRNAPPWLLTCVSTAKTLNSSSYDMMSHLTDKEWSNVMSGLAGKEKRDVRGKLLFSMMVEDLQNHASEALSSLYAGKKGKTDVSYIDTFYATDFQEVMLPFFFGSLKAQLGEGATNFRWKDLVHLKDAVLPGSLTGRLMGRMTETDEETMLGKATPLQVRRALRDAVAVYLPYINARMALEKREEFEAAKASGKEDLEAKSAEGNFSIKLSDVVARLNESTTYGGRKIGDMTTEELRNIEIPIPELAKLSRKELYNATVSDPITRRRLLEIYEEHPEGPGFRGTNDSTRYAVRSLLSRNLGVDPHAWSTGSDRSKLYDRRVVSQHHPQELSQQVLSEEISNHFSINAVAGHGASDEWANALFPSWNVEKTAANGAKVSLDRPPVLIPRGYTYPKGVNPKEILSQLGDLSSLDGKTFSQQNLKGVVLDIDSYTEQKRLYAEKSAFAPGIGDIVGQKYDEPNFVAQASFFFTDEKGDTYVLRRSSFVYRNEDDRRGEQSQTWKLERGADLVYRAAEYEFERTNRNERAELEGSIASRVTTKAIERSNAAPESGTPFVRQNLLGDLLYRGEPNQPSLFVSAASDIKLTPGSPAFQLLESLAKPDGGSSLKYEIDPSAVFIELQTQPDGSIVALASYVENRFAAGQERYHSENSIHTIRRKAAVAEKNPASDSWSVNAGTTRSGINLSEAKSLLKRFGDSEAILKTSFAEQKTRGNSVMESALAELFAEGKKLSSDEFTSLDASRSLLEYASGNGQVLFTSRAETPGARPQAAKYRGKDIQVLFPNAQSFDNIDIHHDDDKVDEHYSVFSASDLLGRANLSSDQLQRILDLYCTPLATPEQSLLRMFKLFPHQVSGNESAQTRLIAALKIPYERASDKKIFLRNLFDRLQTLGGWISLESVEKLAVETRLSLAPFGTDTQEIAPGQSLSTLVIGGQVKFMAGDITSGKTVRIEGVKAADSFYSISALEREQVKGPLLVSILGSDGSILVDKKPLAVLRKKEGGGTDQLGPTDSPNELAGFFDGGQNVSVREGPTNSRRGYFEIDARGTRKFGENSLIVTTHDAQGSMLMRNVFGQASDIGKRTPSTGEATAETSQDRVLREINVRTLNALVLPSSFEYADNPIEFNRPLLRILNLFPCAATIDTAERTRFVNRIATLYRGTDDRSAFLRSLFEAMEKEAGTDGILKSDMRTEKKDGRTVFPETKVFGRIETVVQLREQEALTSKESEKIEAVDVDRMINAFRFAPDFYAGVEKPLRDYIERKGGKDSENIKKMPEGRSVSDNIFRKQAGEMFAKVKPEDRQKFIRAMRDGLTGLLKDGLVQPTSSAEQPSTRIEYYPPTIKALLQSLNTQFDLQYFAKPRSK